MAAKGEAKGEDWVVMGKHGHHSTGEGADGALAGKRALVTGAANGIGAACARTLAGQGVWTACADMVPPDETMSLIKDSSGRGIGIECDVSREADVKRLFSEVEAQGGGIDILVHCAGVIHEKPLLDTSEEEFSRVMDINLKGTFLIGREAIRAMGRTGGRVILIASDLGYLGRETFSAYVASKHGVMGLMRSWAKEFAPDILVNAICPGPIDTAMLDQQNMSPEWRARELDIPLARFGRPEEVAQTAVFLASPAAGFITGQGLGVNGGSVMP